LSKKKGITGLRTIGASILLSLALIAGSAHTAVAQSAFSEKWRAVEPAQPDFDFSTSPAGVLVEPAQPDFDFSMSPAGVLVDPPAKKGFTIEAGPLNSTAQATKICPTLCAKQNATYTSQWWTTIKGKMSVCQCLPI